MIELCIVETTDIEGVNPILFSLLSEDERNYVQRYRAREDRQNSLLGMILAHYIFEKIFSYSGSIKRTANGKPYIDSFSWRGDISISHSNRIVTCAVNPFGKVGVDVEEIRDIDFAITAEFLSPREQGFLNSLMDEQEKFLALYKFWTLKESFLKATGTGLFNIPLSSLEFDCTNQPIFISQTNLIEKWRFFQHIHKSYCLSLCYTLGQNSFIQPRIISLDELTGCFFRTQ